MPTTNAAAGSNRDLNRRIGVILKAYRLRNGLTQKDLARNANVSQGAISHVEQGLRSKLNTLETISLALGSTLSETIARAETARDASTLRRDAKRLLKRLTRSRS